MSLPPRPARSPPPKFAVAVEEPTTITLPLESTATAWPTSSPVPPKTRDHRWAPPAVYFATNRSFPPPPVRGPPPKSAVPETRPVTTRQLLPFTPSQLARVSTALAPTQSLPALPKRRDDTYAPMATGHAGVFVLAVLLVAERLPALSRARTVYEYTVDAARGVSEVEVAGASTILRGVALPFRYTL